MLQNLLISLLLISAACAMHLEYLKVNSDQELPDEILALAQDEELSMPEAELPGKCWACKWAMRKLKRTLGNRASQDKIRAKLNSVCNSLGFLKSMCNRMLQPYTETLIEELSTSDDPATICRNVGFCTSRRLQEFIEAFPEIQQKL
ncbi:saposin-C-like isoform X1 [Hoplias malabaricus]|uniref:saposin-C-like isoform X1 n=1 Tax=Hoplias malabaricus TaxID=27720 RepID=UPI00346382E9